MYSRSATITIATIVMVVVSISTRIYKIHGLTTSFSYPKFLSQKISRSSHGMESYLMNPQSNLFLYTNSMNRFSHSINRKKSIKSSSSLLLLLSSLVQVRSIQPILLSIRSDPWYVWTILSLASTVGLVGEKTNIGATLSSPLTTTLITMILCNVGLLPAQSTVYNTVLKVFVPLAIPLLLLDADIKKCIRRTGSLLKAFLIGTVGTIVGTIIAFMLVPLKELSGASSIASALCARHIGGAVNFVAVAEVLSTPADVVAAALAADNVIVALYFTFLFAITSPGPIVSTTTRINRTNSSASSIFSPTESINSSTTSINSKEGSSPIDESITISSTKPEEVMVASTSVTDNVKEEKNSVTLSSLSSSISLALLLYTISHIVATHLPGNISPILIVSMLVISIATIFSKPIGSLSQAGGVIGVLFMQLFFAVIGSMGHIPTVLRIAPSLFLHTAIQIIVHFIFSISVASRLSVSFNEMILASNANVGGPTTAAAMASNKRWQNLVLPALLTGVFGYAIATVIGILISRILPFLPTR